MIPEAGQIALIIALCLSVLLGTVPMVGAWRGQRWAMNLAPSLAAGVFVFLSIAFACLTIVFLQDDFSVKVVASNSNSLCHRCTSFLPFGVTTKVRCCCGSGSWGLVAGGGHCQSWSSACCIVACPCGAWTHWCGFIAFSLFTSNPFERLLPGVAAEGNDLNPLLQDPGLIIHPPLLYMGMLGWQCPLPSPSRR